MRKFEQIPARPLVAAASGLLLALGYPPFDMGGFAWIALAPLAWVLIPDSERDTGGAFVLGWTSGFVFFLASLYWLLAIPVELKYWLLLLVGYAVLAAYLAAYFGAWAAGFRLFGRSIGFGGASRRIAICVLGATLWVALEWVRSWMFSGFPWNFLGVSQYKMTSLIQIASVTGVYGVSFWLCFVNLALTFTAWRYWQRARGGRLANGGALVSGAADRPPSRRFAASPPPFSQWGSQISWEFTVAMLVVLVSGMNGARQLIRDASQPSRLLPVALVQGNVPQDLKWSLTEGEKILSDYARLTRQAGASGPRLIVWPEAATPHPEYALRLVNVDEHGAREIRYAPRTYDLLKGLAQETGAALLVGSLDVVGALKKRQTGNCYNAAFFIEPAKAIGEPYRKMRLVPFGEYVPLEKWLPFMKMLTPVQGSFAAGDDYTIFELEERAAKFGVVICFEDVMPGHCRHFVQRGADFLVTITNDAWFKRTAGAYQHAANSVFRAVENRRPLLRCANTGVTCVVSPTGRIVQVLQGGPREKVFVQGVLSHTLALTESPTTTFYTKHGDVFAVSCLVVSTIALAACFLVTRRRRVSPRP